MMLGEWQEGWGMLAQAVPVVDGKYVLYVVLRILHILSAMILVGGLFYTKVVLVPTGVDPYAGNRQVWAKWVGIATLFLLVSGLVNFRNIMLLAKANGTPLPPAYHMLFGIKFLLGLFLMFLAAILSGKTALAEKFRQKMGKWLVSLSVVRIRRVIQNGGRESF